MEPATSHAALPGRWLRLGHPAAGPPPAGNNNRLLVLILVAVVVLGVVVAAGFWLTRPAGTPAATPTPAAAPTVVTPTAAAAPTDAEVRVEPVGFLGPDPFTSPIGTDVQDVPATRPPIATLVNGGLPGLYGGTNETRCDRNQLVAFLQADQRKVAAFASVLGITAADAPTFVTGLAEAVLRSDTAVTSHGFRNGEAIRVAAVLQAGTRVLVGDKGIPVVRCQTGSPLAPAGQYSNPSYVGQRWTSFNPAGVTTIQPAPQPLTGLQLTNVYNGAVYAVPVNATVPSVTPGPQVAVGAPAAPVTCGQTPPSTPQPGQYLIVTNNSSLDVTMFQYPPNGSPLSVTIPARSPPSSIDLGAGDFLTVHDAQTIACLQGVSGPGSLTVN